MKKRENCPSCLAVVVNRYSNWTEKLEYSCGSVIKWSHHGDANSIRISCQYGTKERRLTHEKEIENMAHDHTALEARGHDLVDQVIELTHAFDICVEDLKQDAIDAFDVSRLQPHKDILTKYKRIVESYSKGASS